MMERKSRPLQQKHKERGPKLVGRTDLLLISIIITYHEAEPSSYIAVASRQQQLFAK